MSPRSPAEDSANIATDVKALITELTKYQHALNQWSNSKASGTQRSADTIGIFENWDGRGYEAMTSDDCPELYKLAKTTEATLRGSWGKLYFVSPDSYSSALDQVGESLKVTNDLPPPVSEASKALMRELFGRAAGHGLMSTDRACTILLDLAEFVASLSQAEVTSAVQTEVAIQIMKSGVHELLADMQNFMSIVETATSPREIYLKGQIAYENLLTTFAKQSLVADFVLANKK